MDPRKGKRGTCVSAVQELLRVFTPIWAAFFFFRFLESLGQRKKLIDSLSISSPSFFLIYLELLYIGVKAVTSLLWICSAKSGVLYVVASLMSHFSYLYASFNSLNCYKGIKLTFVDVSRTSDCSLSSYPAVQCILPITASFKTYTSGALPSLAYLESCSQETAFVIYHLNKYRFHFHSCWVQDTYTR